jgi:type II secretory pathway pseudopilin PulG
MIDGTYVVMVVVGLLLLLAVERYSAWLRWDRYRRLKREAHRNLQRTEQI